MAGRIGLALVLAAGLLGPAAPAWTQEAAEEDEFGGLPADEGRETVFYTCTACHSTAIIMQQGMSRSRWDHTLEWMVAKQGMPELAPEVREEILTYLAANFGEDRGGQPSAAGGMAQRPAMGIALPPMPGGR